MSTYGQEPPADPWTDGDATPPTAPVTGAFGVPPAPPAAPYDPPPPYHPAGPTYAQPAVTPQYAQVPQQGYAHQPSYPQAGYAESDYPQEAWQQPPKQKSTVMIVLVTLLVVVVLAGAGVGVYLYLNKSGTTPEFIPQAGTCITVSGSNQITPATCGRTGSYKVLQEISVPTASQSVAAERCKTVPGNQAVAWFHVERGSGTDYVLCLSK